MTKSTYKQAAIRGDVIGFGLDRARLDRCQEGDALAIRRPGMYAAAQERLAELEKSGASFDVYDALPLDLRQGISVAQEARAVRVSRAAAMTTAPLI